MKSNENGRSMIEMLGVLAIVGVLSVGGILGYSKAMGKYKVNQLLHQMAELTINIRTLFFQQNEFDGLNEQVLINAGLVPYSMLSTPESAQNIIHVLGGKIKVFPSKDSHNKYKAFEIYADKLNKSACLELATTDWGSDPASGFISLYIGTAVDEIDAPQMENIYAPTQQNPALGIFTTGTQEYSIPLSPSEALSACTCSVNECVVGMKYM